MDTTTAPATTPTREILEDRWRAVMTFERTGGNPSPEFEELAGFTGDMLRIDSGADQDAWEAINDDTLIAAIGDVIIDRVLAEGISPLI